MATFDKTVQVKEGTMTRMKLLGFLMAGLTLAACGEGEHDDKQLDALTGDDVQDVCDEFRELYTFSKQDACELLGITFAVLGDNDCATTRDECMSAPGQPQSGGRCTPSAMAKCSLTVAEVKACFAAEVRALKSLTCESSITDMAGIPAECQVVADECPGVLLGGGQ